MKIGLTLLMLVTSYVHGYRTGAPEEACDTLLPAHGSEPQSTPCPYHINTVTNQTRQDVKVSVTTDSGYPAYRGILLQVRRQEDDVIVGSWVLDDDVNFQTTSCSNLPNSSVTHTNESMKPSSAVFTWTPWNGHDEILYIAVTFVESYNKFWVGNRTNRPGGLIGACISSPCGEGTCFLDSDDSSKYICKCPGDVEGSQCPPLSTDNATTEGTTGASPAITINEGTTGASPAITINEETLVAIMAPSAFVLLIVVIGLACYCNWRIKKTREDEDQSGGHGNSPLPRLSQKRYVRDDEAPYENTTNVYAETMQSPTGSEERQPEESIESVRLSATQPQLQSHSVDEPYLPDMPVGDRFASNSPKYENEQVVRGLHGTHQRRQNYINQDLNHDHHEEGNDSSCSYVNPPQSHGTEQPHSSVGDLVRRFSPESSKYQNDQMINGLQGPSIQKKTQTCTNQGINQDHHEEGNDLSRSYVNRSQNPDSIEEPRSPVGDLIHRFSPVSSKYVNDQVGKSLPGRGTQKKRLTYNNQGINQNHHADGDDSRRPTYENRSQHSHDIEEPRSPIGDLGHHYSPVNSKYVNDQVGKNLPGPGTQKNRQTYINQGMSQDSNEEEGDLRRSYVNSHPGRNDTQDNEHVYDPVCIN